MRHYSAGRATADVESRRFSKYCGSPASVHPDAAGFLCPVKVILRGSVVLSLLAGALCFALVKFGPKDRQQAFQPSTPIFAIPQLKLTAFPSTPAEAAPTNATTVVAMSDPEPSQVRTSFLSMLGTALASRDDVIRFGPMTVKHDIVQAIVKAAHATDTDPVLLMAIADKESSFASNAEARTSSAKGLFQFVDTTWLSAVREFGPQFGLAREASEILDGGDRLTIADSSERRRILDLRKDPYLSAVFAAQLLKRDNEKLAERIGRGLTDGESYLSHFLGPDDAERFMEKVVGQPEYKAAALLPRPAHANAGIFYDREGRRAHGLSVAAVHDKVEDMMGRRIDRYKKVASDADLSAFAETDDAKSTPAE